jgi:hypothetical protein
VGLIDGTSRTLSPCLTPALSAPYFRLAGESDTSRYDNSPVNAGFAHEHMVTTRDEAARIEEIDLGSVPRKLGRMRLVDYLLVFVAGPMVVGALISFISRWSLPSLIDLDLALMRGLLLFVGLRNFGMIEPSNWFEYMITLPFALIFSLLVIYGSISSGAHLSEEQSRGVLYLVTLAGASLLGGVTAFQLLFGKIGPSNTRLTDWLSQLDAQGVAATSGIKTRVVDRRRGLLLAGCGCFVLALPYLVLLALPLLRELVTRFGLFLSWFAFGLLVRSKRYFQPNAEVLLAVDRRSPVLLLRSFKDDEKAHFGMGERQLFDFSLEARLVRHFMRFGPFIAVGSPLDNVPQIGAARAKLADNEWQGVVLSWMRAASVIVMLAGKTKWVTWELSTLVEGQYLEKLILLVPSTGFRRARRRAESVARLEHVKSALSDTGWAKALAAIDRTETVRAITFGSHGTMTLIRGKDFSRDAYHLAALLAHDRMLPSAMPERPLRKGLWSRRVVVACVSLAGLGLVPLLAPHWVSSLCAKSDVYCALAGQQAPSKVAPVTAKIQAITAAADSFVALAKDSSQTGRAPRQSDSVAKPLLDLVLDTSDLQGGPVRPMSAIESIEARHLAVLKIFSVYALAGTGVTDFAALPNDPAILQKTERNTVEFSPEMGRCIDAQLWLAATMIDSAYSFLSTAPKSELDHPNVEQGLAEMRSGFTSLIRGAITTLATTGLTDAWRRDRLRVLPVVGPKAAKFLLPEQLRALREAAIDVAGQLTDPTVKTELTSFTATLVPR